MNNNSIFNSLPPFFRNFLVILSLFRHLPLEAVEKTAFDLKSKFPEKYNFNGNVPESLIKLKDIISYDENLHNLIINKTFLDFLKTKQSILPKEEINIAILTKAKWCFNNKIWTDAAYYYGEAGDYEELINTIYSSPFLFYKSMCESFLEIINKILNNKTTIKNPDSIHIFYMQYIIKAQILLCLGKYKESEKLFKESKKIHTSPGTNNDLYGTDTLYKAELAFFTGELDKAEQLFRESIQETRKTKIHEANCKGLFYLFRIYISFGDAASVKETWEQIEAVLKIKDFPVKYEIFDLISGYIYAHTGEIEKIAPWLRNINGDSGFNILPGTFEKMIKLKILFREKRYEEILKYLDKKEIIESFCAFYITSLETEITKAIINFNMGNNSKSLKLLESSYKLSISMNKEIIMPFIEQGEDIKNLLMFAMKTNPGMIPKEWLKSMISKSSAYGKKIAGIKEKKSKNYTKDNLPSLTPQEILVLDLISRGRKRAEIAKEISISAGSLKSTIKLIFDKLDAQNRADAIRIAAKHKII